MTYYNYNLFKFRKLNLRNLNNLSNANEQRDYRIFEEIAMLLLGFAELSRKILFVLI